MTRTTLEAELQDQLHALARVAGRALREVGSEQRIAVAEMSRRAAAYASIQQRVLRPAYRATHWTQVRVDLLTASAVFQRALADVLVADPQAPAFMQRLEAFAASVAALTATNDAALSTAMRAAGLDDDQLALSEARDARGFDGYLSAHSPDPDPQPLPTPSADIASAGPVEAAGG